MYRRRKTYGRRRRRRRRAVRKRHTGFTQNMMMTHKFTQEFQIKSPEWVAGGGSGSKPPPVTAEWGLNDVFNPAISPTSVSQPNFFDEMAIVYKHFKVTSYSINIRMLPQNMNAQGGANSVRVHNVPHTLQFHVGPSDDGYSQIANRLDRQLAPNTQTKRLISGAHSDVQGSLATHTSFSSTSTIRRFYNNGDFADQKFSGSSGTSPTAKLRGTLTAVTAQDNLTIPEANVPAGAQWSYRVFVTLTQNVLWYEPITTAFTRDLV